MQLINKKIAKMNILLYSRQYQCVFILLIIISNHMCVYIIRLIIETEYQYILYCQIMFSLFQDDIHTKANIQLSIKLNNHNVNTPLFKNQRLERIKPRGRVTDPLTKTQFQTNQYNDEIRYKKSDRNSDFDISTHNQTNYMTYVKSSRKDDTIRPLTSNNASRNFRRNQKKKIVNASVGKSLKTMTLQQDKSLKKKNKYEQLEKKYNKGPLQMKYMQNWLNDILLQYCYQQKFDTTIQHPALKKYQIDKNSLLSKGLSNQKIDRIIKSLFVYSLGFNNLLDDLTVSKDSLQLRKTIWKVYAMLTQYCAKGQFETMVGQIERDKLKKIQNLKNQIQKRQKIIDQSEQLDRERNLKIIKQIKQLKQENKNLLNEKFIIQEDLKQADQAFNQQVSLRLKFQHKINQINGVHRELGIKHMRLYQDFNAYKIQYAKVMEQKRKQTQRIQQLLLKILKLEQQNQKLCQKVKHQSQEIETYQYRLQFFTKKSSEQQVKGYDVYTNQKQKQRQINILKFQIDNAQGIIKLKQNALIDQYKQVELLIQENKHLFEKIEQQKVKIQQLSNIQYRFQLATLNIKTNCELLTEKYNKSVEQINKHKSENQKLNKNIYALQNQLNLMIQKNKLLAGDIQSYISNIQLMKKSNNSIEDELFTIKQRNLAMTQIIANKQIIETQLTKKLNDALTELLKTKTELSDTQSKMKFQEDTFNHQKNLISTKYQKLKKQSEQLIKTDTKRRQLMIILQAQNQKCKRQDLDIKSKLRDQIFERYNIQLKYKQSLLVMQEQNKYIKQLNINMSHIKEQKQSFKRQLQSTEFVLQQKTQQFKKQIHMLNNQIQTLKKQIQKKNEWIHPMYYWDLYGLFCKTNSAKQQLIKLIDKLKIQMMNNQNIAMIQKNEMKQLYEQDKIKYVSSYEKMIKDLKMQIKKLEENKQQAFIETSELRLTMKKYQQYFSVSQNPKEKALIQTIKEKSEKLQIMIKQNQILQDKNLQINKNLLNCNKQLFELKKEAEKNKNIIAKIQTESGQLKQIKIQKQNLRKKLIYAQENYNKILEQLKKCRQVIKQKNKAEQKMPQQFQQFQQFKVKQTQNQQLQIYTDLSFTQINNDKIDQKEAEVKTNQLQIQQKIEKIQHIQKTIEKTIEKSERSKTKEQISRKQITKKIKGAFNYYNKISK